MWLGLTVAALLASACGGDGSDSAKGAAGSDGERTVVAGFYPLAFAAQEIGGSRVEVVNLTPPGAEPHDLELSPRDVQQVRSADLVLYLGRGFQPALEDAVQGAEGVIVDLLRGFDLLAVPGGEDGEGIDPHIWLDPVRYAEMIEEIGEALGEPGQASGLADRVKRLHLEFEAGLADCERRELVTSHAAFEYLAARYGLEQLAITSLAPEAEPAPRELERVAELARERGATTIFFERLLSPELAETVAREIGARTAVLDPLEGLTEEEVERGEDYFSIMRANLKALREGLGCR